MFDGIPPVTVSMTNSLFSRDVVVIYGVPPLPPKTLTAKRMNNDTQPVVATILSAD